MASLLAMFDHAGDFAARTKLLPAVRQCIDALDSAGSSTATIGKGLVMGFAAFLARTLPGAFKGRAAAAAIDVPGAWTSAGLSIGAPPPPVLSAMAMQ